MVTKMSEEKCMQNRIWEIDFLRGMAILLMAVFHLAVDLRDFYGVPLDYFHGFWYVEGKLSAVMFMLLAGISTIFGRNILRHGVKIFCWGMVLTFVTYIYDPGTYIRFGILHLLGASLVLVYFMRRLSVIALCILAVIILGLGNVFIYQTAAAAYLFPFGLTTAEFVSMDYYPLLPWYGVFLCGTVAGRLLYRERRSLLKKPWHFEGLEEMGRHSLLIYLIHQPLLLAGLFLLHKLISF